MKAQDLKNSVLQLAMQGKLVHQKNDESASTLLENIKQEKDQLIKSKIIRKNKNESTIFRKNESFYEKIGKGDSICIDDEIPFDVPDNWELCRLGNLCSLINPKLGENGSYPYLNAKYLRNKVDPEIKEKGRFVEKDTKVILVDGENSGEVFLTHEDGYMGSTFRILYINSQVYDKYILKLLELWKNPLRKTKKGAAIPHLNKDIFNNILVGIPPFEEQERIVSKIEEVLPFIDEYGVNEEQLNNLNKEFPSKLKSSILQEAIQGKLVPQNPNDEHASTLLENIKKEKEELIKAKKIKRNNKESTIYKENGHYYERIGKKGEPTCIDDELPFEIPDNWEWCRLGFIGDWGAGATPKRGEPKYYLNGTITWLKTGDLNNSIINEVPEFITEIALQETSVRLNPIGSVLIAMYGATIGKVGILNIEATTNQACCACLPFNGIYNKYLFYYLMSQNKNFNKMGEGGAQPNISRTKIINYLFPVPPLNEQKRIVEKIEKILTEIEILN